MSVNGEHYGTQGLGMIESSRCPKWEAEFVEGARQWALSRHGPNHQPSFAVNAVLFLVEKLERVKREERAAGWDEGWDAAMDFRDRVDRYNRELAIEAEDDPLSTPGDSGIRPPRPQDNPYRPSTDA